LTAECILETHNVKKWFGVRGGFLTSLFKSRPMQYIKAVDGISISVKPGEIFAVVGESGCGKTTLARLVLRLEEITDGKVLFNGENISAMPRYEFKKYRTQIQMIFQDPYGSLNSTMTIKNIIAEPLRIHRICDTILEEEEKIKKALEEVGLTPIEDFLNRYPHELSGGQRQRVAIAAALVLDPILLIADEPVSMLDVSMRGQILQLLLELQKKRGITIVLITHNLAVARQMADRIAVTYLGRVVETGDANTIISDPKHPYTKALISVVPVPEAIDKREKTLLTGETPNPINLPSGCRFRPRCPSITEACKESEPELKKLLDDREVACHLFESTKPMDKPIPTKSG
jgi:oligopeptide/dipeptide ABC transporter ATP-binding protein